MSDERSRPHPKVVTTVLNRDHQSLPVLAPNSPTMDPARLLLAEATPDHPNPFNLGTEEYQRLGVSPEIALLLCESWRLDLFQKLPLPIPYVLWIYYSTVVTMENIAEEIHFTNTTAMKRDVLDALGQLYGSVSTILPEFTNQCPREKAISLKKISTRNLTVAGRINLQQERQSICSKYRWLFKLIKDNSRQTIGGKKYFRAKETKVPNDVIIFFFSLSLPETQDEESGLGVYWKYKLLATEIITEDELNYLEELFALFADGKYDLKKTGNRPSISLDPRIIEKLTLAAAYAGAGKYYHPFDLLGLSLEDWQRAETTNKRKEMVLWAYDQIASFYPLDKQGREFSTITMARDFLLAHLDADANNF